MSYLAETFSVEPASTSAFEEFSDLLASQVGSALNHSERRPYEYSVELTNDGAEVRIFLRPWGSAGDRSSRTAWERGWGLLEEMAERGWADLSLITRLEDLFSPRSREAALGMCLGVGFTRYGPLTKAYLDANAAGADLHLDVLEEAFSALSMEGSWEWLRGVEGAYPSAKMRCLSLDLIPSRGRLKVYVMNGASSPRAVVDRSALLHPNGQDLIISLMQAAGMRSDSEWAGAAQPVMCWSFNSPRVEASELTVYLPSNRHMKLMVEGDRKLLEAIPASHWESTESFLSDNTLMSQRGGESMNPFHWVARKATKGQSVTLYSSADIVEQCMVASRF